jgi:hypothetical protein
MAFNKKKFQQVQEQDVGIQMKLGDDATYPMTAIRNISFKNILSISSITDIKCIFEFNGQHCPIKDCSQKLPWFLAKKEHEGKIYKLLVDTTKHWALVHDSGKLRELWHKHLGDLH